ncbi:MAG: GAF domain-containing protein [Candidatus Methylomirabilia bacterium]
MSIPSTGLEPLEVFSLAIDRLTRLLIVDRAALFLLDTDQGRLHPRAARGFRSDDLLDLSLLPGDGLIGHAFREGRPFVYATPVGEAPADPFLFRFPVRDAVALPIRSAGEVVGVLFAGRRGRPAPFTGEEVQLLTLIADRVGTALVHRRLVERLGAHVDHLKELVGLTARASLRHEIQDVLSLACEAGCRLLKVRAAAIALLGEDSRLAVLGSYGVPEQAVQRWRPDPLAGVTGELMRSQQVVVCQDLFTWSGPDDPDLKELGVRAFLVVPLRMREELSGCVYLLDQGVKEFSPDEVEAARLLAALVGLAIENGRLFAGVGQAMEELKEAEEKLIQTEKARALEQMAGGIAHEFNNVLAIMLGKIQLILERVTDGQLREDLTVVEEAAWRAAETVRRLQRVAATRSREGLLPLDLNSLVEEAVILTRPRWKDEAEAKGMRLQVVLDVDKQVSCVGNAQDLREMLVNLILNAIDAMPDGGRVSIATRRDHDRVELTVADTGAGMTEDVQRRIFDPFFTTHSPQRAGLGLSVVHGIVARHQGTIKVESRQAEGTIFRIRLPLAPGMTADTKLVAPQRAKARVAPASVLIIEDEDAIRRMLSDLLATKGHAVQSAREGLEGLARFKRGTFDVVITDLSVPGCSGLEVSREVKRTAPATAVILMTGWGELLDPARTKENGVDLVIAKPFGKDRVLNVLAEALSLRRDAE